MNQPPKPKNGDVDGASSASSSGSTYVPPGRRNQILGSQNGGSRQQGSGTRTDAGANGRDDERFANFRSRDSNRSYDSRGPRSGSDGVGERKTGQSFFDRPNTSSAPRRSKWQDDEYDRRDDRERGGRRGRPQVGPDGLLPRDQHVEEELFGNHSNTGINFDKYQVCIPLTFFLPLPFTPPHTHPPTPMSLNFANSARNLQFLPFPPHVSAQRSTMACTHIPAITIQLPCPPPPALALDNRPKSQITTFTQERDTHRHTQCRSLGPLAYHANLGRFGRLVETIQLNMILT